MTSTTTAPPVDFTSYTETDPNGRITVTADEIAFAGLTRNEDAHVYKDFGVAYFSGDFNIDFEFRRTALNTGIAVICGLTNDVDDFRALITGGKDYQGVHLSEAGDVAMGELDGGTPYFDGYAVSNGTTYYCTFVRDESIGSYGRLYLYIYSDAARTTLLDTLQVDLHTSKKDFRYLFFLDTYNDGQGAFTISGSVYNAAIYEP